MTACTTVRQSFASRCLVVALGAFLLCLGLGLGQWAWADEVQVAASQDEASSIDAAPIRVLAEDPGSSQDIVLPASAMDQASRAVSEIQANGDNAPVLTVPEARGSDVAVTAAPSAPDADTPATVQDPNQAVVTLYAAPNGWVHQNGKTYYFEDGQQVLGEKCLLDPMTGQPNWYYFWPEDGGSMDTGWTLLPATEFQPARWVYYDDQGHMLHGEQAIDGDWYYLDPETGSRIQGFLYRPDGNKWVYYDPISGKMLYGEQPIDGDWYLLDPYTGAVCYGWAVLPSSGKTVYFDPVTGKMWHGWGYIDGVPQYFDVWTGQHTPQSGVVGYAWTKINRVGSSTDYAIAVDNPACRTVIFQRVNGQWAPIFDWVCGPGTSATPTVRGVYQVGSRGYAFGSGYTCYYWTQFYGDYLFHSIKYNQGTFSVQDGRLGMPVSHGCVRLDIQNAKWINQNIPSGTTVVSY